MGRKGGGPTATALIGLAGLMAALTAWQWAAPAPWRIAGLAVDRLGAALGLLATTVGAVAYRYAERYLDGEPGRDRFLRRLAFTVAAACVLMLASNLLVLFAAWSLTSLGLHGLLTFYPDRPDAIRSARKKFLISRLGDLALIAAIVTAWQAWGTLELHEVLDAAAAPGSRGAARVVGLLIVLAALTKSAQFPFHSWLPETMETPTPVSALMHAGIINAGGVLLLRFAPLIARDPAALLMLTVVGVLTASLGMVAMWAQVKVKRTLAWSTVSQMGFMMIQCGLGAFPAAALHIVGHGCYKAWSFLRSGELPPAGYATTPSPARALTLAAAGVLLSVPGLWLASTFTGVEPWRSPGELALAAIVALSVGQLWVALLGPATGAARAIAAAAGALAAPLGLFVLYGAAESYLAPVLEGVEAPTGPFAWAAAVLPVAAFAALAMFHALLPAFGRTPAGRAFHVHALHGFYFGAVADRVVAFIWNGPSDAWKGVEHV